MGLAIAIFFSLYILVGFLLYFSGHYVYNKDPEKFAELLGIKDTDFRSFYALYVIFRHPVGVVVVATLLMVAWPIFFLKKSG